MPHIFVATWIMLPKLVLLNKKDRKRKEWLKAYIIKGFTLPLASQYGENSVGEIGH